MYSQRQTTAPQAQLYRRMACTLPYEVETEDFYGLESLLTSNDQPITSDGRLILSLNGAIDEADLN